MSARDRATKLMADLAEELGLNLTAQQRDLGAYLIVSEITRSCASTHVPHWLGIMLAPSLASTDAKDKLKAWLNAGAQSGNL